MSEALAPPFLVAALLLCVAGGLKLRSPGGAAAALGVRAPAIRALAIGEVALGAACVVHPTTGIAVALALVYGVFAAVAMRLRRDRVACGCFGDNDIPVSLAHVIASELLGLLAAGAALASPQGVAWLASQPATTGVVLAIAIAGAVYGLVLAYTEAPRAWAAWSGE